MANKRIGLPGWFDCAREADSPREYLADDLRSGDLLELDLGDDGRALFVSGKLSAQTRRGRWCDSALLGCSSGSCSRWFGGHKPAHEGTGLLHFCEGPRCSAKSSRANFAVVHASRFRPLSIVQARTLGYAKDGLASYRAMLDGASIDSGAGVGAIDGADGASTDEEEAVLNSLLGGKASAPPGQPAPVGAGAKPKAGTQLDASLSLALKAADSAAARDAAEAGLPPPRLLGQPAVLGAPPGGAGVLGGHPAGTPKAKALGAPVPNLPRLDVPPALEIPVPGAVDLGGSSVSSVCGRGWRQWGASRERLARCAPEAG